MGKPWDPWFVRGAITYSRNAMAAQALQALNYYNQTMVADYIQKRRLTDTFVMLCDFEREEPIIDTNQDD